jgi:hypothetical protein
LVGISVQGWNLEYSHVRTYQGFIGDHGHGVSVLESSDALLWKDKDKTGDGINKDKHGGKRPGKIWAQDTISITSKRIWHVPPDDLCFCFRVIDNGLSILDSIHNILQQRP